jgi:hypothetical protein
MPSKPYEHGDPGIFDKVMRAWNKKAGGTSEVVKGNKPEPDPVPSTAGMGGQGFGTDRKGFIDYTLSAKENGSQGLSYEEWVRAGRPSK